MSLDVYLLGKKSTEIVMCDHCGQEHEEEQQECFYNANITHNLGEMAEKAGIYEALWRPHRLRSDYNIEEKDYKGESEFEESVTIVAKEIIPILEKGLKDLKARPKYFNKFNSPNGWGMYEHFVPFVEKYLRACKENHEATVKVSR